MSATVLAPAFFLALIVILVVCKLVGRLLRALGQPPVVGEMVAGVVLGPSVLGLLAPSVENFVFPQQLRPVLYVIGQVGLVVFMFQAGYEFRTDQLKRVARSAGLISGAGMFMPILLGAAITLLARGKVPIFNDGVSTFVTVAFVGVTLAITAFPMMARIIIERGLTETHFGRVALACGAIDDAVAWVLLAGVLSIAAGSAGPVALAVGGALVLVAVLLVVARSHGRLIRLGDRLAPEHMLFAIVVPLCAAAWYTDTIGLYAVFGAFSLGVVFPRSAVLDRAVATIVPVGALFLPLFFTYSGLNTNFGLLVDPAVLVFAIAAIVVAVAGKFGACWAAARLAGEPQGISLRVGALMNARGLMQLIAINVGLSAGIVTPALFSVLVLVAIVTTMMATPMLTFWDRRDRRRERDARPAEKALPQT